MPDRRVAIWYAVSSKEQAIRYSLDSQLADCRAFVDAIPTRYAGDTARIVAEISLADTRSIIEFSEAVATYPQSYGLLESLIKGRKIDVLLCTRRDRLGREDSLIITIEALCRRHKVKLIALRSALPSTLNMTDDEGSGYVVAVEAVSARIEVRRLQDRRESGMIGRVTDLLRFPGRRPWGYSYLYKADGSIDSIALDPAIAGTVRYILIDLYLEQGLGTPQIRAALNNGRRLSPSGKPWTQGSVRAILMRADRYAGWIEYNQKSLEGKQYVRVKGNYAPVITDDELRAIKQEIERRTYQPVRRHTALSGICYCGSCNRPMTHNVSYREGKTQTVMRQDMRCVHRDCPGRAMIRNEAIFDALREAAAVIAGMDDDGLTSLLARSPVDIGPIQHRLTGLLAEQTKLAAERERTIHAFIRLQAITEVEFVAELERIDGRQQALEIEIADTNDALATASANSQALAKLRDVREIGAAALTSSADQATLNQWLRQRFIVIVHKKTDTDRRVEVRLAVGWG